MEELIVEEICKKYNKSENFINLLLKICDDNCIFNKEEKINEVCQKLCQNKQQKP